MDMDGYHLVLALLMAITAFMIPILYMALYNARQKQKPEGEREDWEEICYSMVNHPEQWEFKDRSMDEDSKELWGFHYQCRHQKNKEIVFGVFRSPKISSLRDKVAFYSDSKIRVYLDDRARKALYKAFRKAMAWKLKMNLNPEQVVFKQGEFFCPHCGEKVAADIVLREEAHGEEN